MAEAEEGDDEFHEQLKNLMEGSQMNWTCAILWQFSQPQLLWKFQSGYYRSTPKMKEVRIKRSCVSVEELNHTKSQWFFKISQSQTFPYEKDLPGSAWLSLGPVLVNTTDSSASIWRFGMIQSFGVWERTKWSHQFGIQTIFCIPMWKGTRALVLELTSTEIIPYDPQWLQQMADFIHLIGTPHLPIEPPNQRELWNLICVFSIYNNLAILDSQLRDKKRLYEKDNVMQNHGNNNTSKPSQDKEKISDSKCSLSILTKSSDKSKEKISDSKCSISILTKSSDKSKEKISDSKCSLSILAKSSDKGKEKITDSKCSLPMLTKSSDKGKEKISDSKCSWSILTESSDGDTDTHGTFSCSNDYSGPSRVLVSDFYAHQ